MEIDRQIETKSKKNTGRTSPNPTKRAETLTGTDIGDRQKGIDAKQEKKRETDKDEGKNVKQTQQEKKNCYVIPKKPQKNLKTPT